VAFFDSGPSQCCGVYTRADLLPDMLVAETQGKGTTNVDFNPPLRAALAKIRDPDRLVLRVTPERLAVSTPAGDAVEHKIRLPVRWVKGFAEIQPLAATLVPAATLDGPESLHGPGKPAGSRMPNASAMEIVAAQPNAMSEVNLAIEDQHLAYPFDPKIFSCPRIR
jgi:hypothetical protein